MENANGRAQHSAMDLLVGLVMTIGYAIVLGGVLVVLAALTGGLGQEPADDRWIEQQPDGTRH